MGENTLPGPSPTVNDGHPNFRRARINYSNMDSATSPSVPRRMTGQRHTAKDESFQIKESNQKEIYCYVHWFRTNAICIGIGLMLYESALDGSQVNFFLRDSFLWERTNAVHFVLFVVAKFNELVSSSNLSPHLHVILQARLARSCRIHCSKSRGKSSPSGEDAHQTDEGWE